MAKLPEKIGRYEVLRLLGQGAMGSVYLGRDPSLDRQVAIKTVRELDLSDEAKTRFLERFRNEAKAAARLHDPCIVQVFDVGEDPPVGPFLVLEYVKGTTLKHRLRELGRLPPEEVVDVARQIGHALDLAHEREIIHRDVKPDNVLVTEDGRAKLADFGVARLPDAALTKEGQFLGTPCYAAPETLSAGKYGPRTDLFSFAAVLYELASGVRAFPGDDAISVAHAVIHDTPPPPSEASAGKVPKQVDTVIMRGLDKNAAARFESAMELAEAIEAAYVESGVMAATEGATPRAPAVPRKESGGGGGAIAAIVVLALAVIGGGFLLAQGGIGGGGDLGDGAVPDASASVTDAGARTRPRDAGAAPVDAIDAGVDAPDAWEAPDTNDTPVLSRQDREDMAKDELDAARAAITSGNLDSARAHIARARELDPESSDLEEVEGLLQAAP